MGPCNHLGRPYCVLAVAAASTRQAGFQQSHWTCLAAPEPAAPHSSPERLARCSPHGVYCTGHNPFGNGRNVIFIGGSDLDGVEAATGQFIRRLNEADAASGQLTIGWIADITIDSWKGTVPFSLRENRDSPQVILLQALREVPTCHDSITYKGVGRQFGWNSLVELMALYYMTGEELRDLALSFGLKQPAEKAMADKSAEIGSAAVTRPIGKGRMLSLLQDQHWHWGHGDSHYGVVAGDPSEPEEPSPATSWGAWPLGIGNASRSTRPGLTAYGRTSST